MEPIHVDIVGDAEPITDLCRQLVAAGYHRERPLHAYRDGKLAMIVCSIGEGAKLAIDERDENGHGGTPVLKRHKASRSVRKSSEVGPEGSEGRNRPCANLPSIYPIKWGVESRDSRVGAESSADRAFVEAALKVAQRGIVGPAFVVAVELGELVRGSGAPIIRDDESGLWRLKYPDGSLGGIGNRSWVMEAARRHGLIDRTDEHLETDDGRKWRRKVSDYGVMTHVTKLKPAKPPKTNWNQCMTCGGKMKYKPDEGRFCSIRCRKAFDAGAPPFEPAAYAPRSDPAPDALAA